MSKFIKFVIGKNYSKALNEYFYDKKIIKWEILKEKNDNNQYEIFIEYENRNYDKNDFPNPIDIKNDGMNENK